MSGSSHLSSEPLSTPTDVTPSQGKPPWNPILIAWVCLLGSPLAGGLLYAINFARLGQPARRKTVLWWLCGWTLFYLLLALRAGFLTTIIPTPDHFLRTSYLLWAALAAWRLYLGQQRLFARHLKAGGKKASLLSGLLVSLLMLGPLLSIAIGLNIVIATKAEQAQALVTAGKPDQLREAETILKQLTLLEPQEPNYHINLALVYYSNDNPAGADQEARKTLHLDPGNEDALQLLAALAPTAEH